MSAAFTIIVPAGAQRAGGSADPLSVPVDPRPRLPRPMRDLEPPAPWASARRGGSNPETDMTEFNPLKHLHLGDRGTIPLAAGGHAPAEIIAYVGLGAERRLYCQLTEFPGTVVPVRPEAFRRIALTAPLGNNR